MNRTPSPASPALPPKFLELRCPYSGGLITRYRSDLAGTIELYCAKCDKVHIVSIAEGKLSIELEYPPPEPERRVR